VSVNARANVVGSAFPEVAKACGSNKKAAAEAAALYR
jgi:hypothetical protein